MKSRKLEENSLASKYPSIAEQWHPTLNGDVTPRDIKPNTKIKYYWLLPYDDEKTGKHFDFVWEASPNDRVNGNGCPCLTGKAIWIGYNDLENTHPLLAFEWHPWRNGDLKPTEVACNYHKKVWWLYSYDDPVLGHFDFEWEASPNTRMTEPGCPFLEGNGVWPGYNDLLSRNPWVACQFHPTKNGKVSPQEISFASNKKYWWLLQYDDPVLGHFDFKWEAKVVNRTLLGEGCPYLGNDKAWRRFNDLQTRFPEISAQWYPKKNGTLTPSDVVFGTPKSVWWMLPYVDPDTGRYFEFEWKAPVNIRTGVGTNDGHQTGCPYLAPNPKVWKGFNDLASCYEEIAKDWHPTKNRTLTPEKVYKKAIRKVWWKCHTCGHEWFGSIKGRTVDGVECEKCRESRVFDF